MNGSNAAEEEKRVEISKTTTEVMSKELQWVVIFFEQNRFRLRRNFETLGLPNGNTTNR